MKRRRKHLKDKKRKKEKRFAVPEQGCAIYQSLDIAYGNTNVVKCTHLGSCEKNGCVAGRSVAGFGVMWGNQKVKIFSVLDQICEVLTILEGTVTEYHVN